MRKIKYLVIDVDGTMTDSGIYFDDFGNELKKFSTKDAAGIFAARGVGIRIIVLTGRECPATEKRMRELKIDIVNQNVKDKCRFLKNYMVDNNIKKDEIGYIGDDLNDYSSMKMVGYKACPSDSCKEIVDICDYVSHVAGGHGAVRDIIEHMLRESGEWEESIKNLYGLGT